MKRAAVTILLALYFISSTGATIHFHYCMGQLARSSFLPDNSKKCGKCGMEKANATAKGCCHDRTEWVKIQDDQKISVASYAISLQNLPETTAVQANDPTTSPNIYIDPSCLERKRCCDIPPYLFNRVFRI